MSCHQGGFCFYWCGFAHFLVYCMLWSFDVPLDARVGFLQVVLFLPHFKNVSLVVNVSINGCFDICALQLTGNPVNSRPMSALPRNSSPQSHLSTTTNVWRTRAGFGFEWQFLGRWIFSFNNKRAPRDFVWWLLNLNQASQTDGW